MKTSRLKVYGNRAPDGSQRQRLPDRPRYVENRCLNHLADISTVRRRTASSGLEVVKPTWLLITIRTVRQLHNHALSTCSGFPEPRPVGHCGVTVDGNWQHFVAARLTSLSRRARTEPITTGLTISRETG